LGGPGFAATTAGGRRGSSAPPEGSASAFAPARLPAHAPTVVAPGSADTVLLGTIALEPNRWGTVTGRREATITLRPWLDALAGAGFAGLEVWEPHLHDAAAEEVEALADRRLPVVIINSYAPVQDETARAGATGWAEQMAARAVKFNTGTDLERVGAEGEAAAAWLAELPASAALLCECHHGTAAGDDPEVAARFLAAVGPSDRVQAIVHTHEGSDRVAARFDAYGERIHHVHVNHLDAGSAPRLADVDDLAARVAHLRAHGFEGSWTLEFVHGLLTEHDEPAPLLEQAAADLPVLRDALA